MSLKLELELLRETVPLGGEVPLRLTLRNGGSASEEVASLFDNNTITNYVLHDADGKPLATLNHVTRQRLMEKVEPRTTDLRMIQLSPGATEVRQDNLCRYHWFERPGTFTVRGLYRWKGIELWSEPCPLTIAPAPLLSFDQQWSHHYGEKFLLHSAWTVERPGGWIELFFRESMRFRPGVINTNAPLLLASEPFSPRVSFNRSLIAGGSVWLAWLTRGAVTVLKTTQGHLDGESRTHALPLDELDWVAPPLTSDTGDVILMVSGLGPGVGGRVMALHLRPDGTEERRQELTPAIPRVGFIGGACNQDNGFHLLWTMADTHELWHLPIELATLQPSAAPTMLWQADWPIAGVFTPPVFDEDGFLACMFVRQEAKVPHLDVGIVWLQLQPDNNPLKLERLTLPGEEPLLRCRGEMGPGGRVFVLASSRRSVRYINASVMQLKELAAPEDLFPQVEERLTINSRGDVFLMANRRPYGLSETLLHRGSEEDLGDEDEEEAP